MDKIVIKKAKAEVVPSSSLVEVELGIEVEAEVGVEVRVMQIKINR